MTAKEYLQQIWRADRHINILIRQKNDLRTQLYRGSGGMQIKERVQSSPDGDPYIRLIARIDVLDRKIDREIDRLVALKEKITGEIMAMDNPRYAEILHDRYVLLMPWEDIAAALGDLDLRWVYRIHGKALMEFEKTFLKNDH